MKHPATAAVCAALFLSIVGCGPGVGGEESYGQVQEALTNAEIIHFTNPSAWTVYTGAATLGTGANGGLALSNLTTTYVEVQSAPLTPIGTLPNQVGLWINIPVKMPWGQLKMAFDAPSAGLYSRYTNTINLAGVGPGLFLFIFQVASDVPARMASARGDLRVRVAVGGPTTAAPFELRHIAFESCNRNVGDFVRWPLDGEYGRDWVINNFFDHAGGSAFVDFRNGDRTYDGHEGTDIDIPSFRQMDDGSALIHAVVPGIVFDVQNTNFDRNTNFNNNPANLVAVRMANGYTVRYKHNKARSAQVSPGRIVNAGDVLATAGSSGNSTQPHLHLEVVDCSGLWVDPYPFEQLQSMWAPGVGPDYTYKPAHVMDSLVYPVGTFASVPDSEWDPSASLGPAELLSVPTGTQVELGLSVSRSPTDNFVVTLASPLGVQVPPVQLPGGGNWTFSSGSRYGHEAARSTLLQPSAPRSWVPTTPGLWRFDVTINGGYDYSHWFWVPGGIPAGLPELAAFGIPATMFQPAVDDITSAGYRLHYIDGFEDRGQPFFNLIFLPADGRVRRVRAGMDLAAFEQEFLLEIALGRLPTHIESYLVRGKERFATIFDDVPQPGTWIHAGRSKAEHDANLAAQKPYGLEPVVISVVNVNGVPSYSALLQIVAPRQAEILPVSAYQSALDMRVGLGQQPLYVNALQSASGPQFSVIWGAALPGLLSAVHGQSGAAFLGTYQTQFAAGARTEWVAGYNDGTQALYAGAWRL